MAKVKNEISDLATNKKAFRDYEILEKIEAGIKLKGTEVKSCRNHSVNFTDAYAEVRKGEVYLRNLNIAHYKNAADFNHEPTRVRKLLMHKKQIIRTATKLDQKRLTLVPLRIYLMGNLIKVELGLARGKRKYEKRDDIKKREAQQEINKAMKRSLQKKNF